MGISRPAEKREPHPLPHRPHAEPHAEGSVQHKSEPGPYLIAWEAVELMAYGSNVGSASQWVALRISELKGRRLEGIEPEPGDVPPEQIRGLGGLLGRTGWSVADLAAATNRSEADIVAWLSDPPSLDQDAYRKILQLMKVLDYLESAIRALFARGVDIIKQCAEGGALRTIGRRIGGSGYEEIPRLDWVGDAYLDMTTGSGTAALCPAGAGIRKWWDVRFSRADLDRLYALATHGATGQGVAAHVDQNNAEGNGQPPQIPARLEIPRASATEPAGSKSQTGLPGRPSSRHLWTAEFRARISRGTLCDTLDAEAEALVSWLSGQHPDVARPTPKTVKNAIRQDYRAAQSANRQRPKI